MAWNDIADNQMVTFTNVWEKWYSIIKAGQSPSLSNKCITKAEALTKYNFNASFMQSFASNQLVPKINYSACNTICCDVQIGDQIWTTCNLDVEMYNDGTPIPQVTTQAAWAATTVGAWCWYANTSANGVIYGRLYNWAAVMGIWDSASRTNPALRKQIAPPGYHVPSFDEWDELITATGGTNYAGNLLKETGTAHWTTTTAAVTNASGFTALGGGYRYYANTFTFLKGAGYWWTATENSTNTFNAWYANLVDFQPNANLDNAFNKLNGMSVRLIRDVAPAPTMLYFSNVNPNNTSTYLVTTKTIELPLVSNGVYNFVVDWGDGQSQLITSYSERSHTYTTSTYLWSYNVSLTGQVYGFSYKALSADQKNLIRYIYTWGNIKFKKDTSAIPISDQLFRSCNYLEMDYCTDAPDLSAITDLDNCFDGCNRMGKIGGIELWDVSTITTMYAMFSGTGSSLSSTILPQDLGNWDVSNVTDMGYMYYASETNHIIGMWDVGQVTDMSSMFQNAIWFNNGGVDTIKYWDTTSVIYVASMFYGAQSFNQPLTNFNFTHVTNTTYMFANCYVFNQDCSNWERVGSTMQWITDTFSMFGNCRKFNGGVNTWNVQRLVTPQAMFLNCYEFNQPMSNWVTLSFSDTSGMFQNCFKFNQNLGAWRMPVVTQMSTYQEPFHALDIGDANRPTSSFDLSPANLSNTLLGWAPYIATSTNNPIHFPSTANGGTCTGITQIKAKSWRIWWVDTAGNAVMSSC